MICLFFIDLLIKAIGKHLGYTEYDLFRIVESTSFDRTPNISGYLTNHDYIRYERKRTLLSRIK